MKSLGQVCARNSNSARAESTKFDIGDRNHLISLSFWTNSDFRSGDLFAPESASELEQYGIQTSAPAVAFTTRRTIFEWWPAKASGQPGTRVSSVLIRAIVFAGGRESKLWIASKNRKARRW